LKTNLTKLICGLALLGAAATAPAQTNLLAGWEPYNAGSQTFPYAALVFDPSSVSSAFMNYVGLTPVNSSLDSEWGVNNHSSTLDTATAPYLQWTINLTADDTYSDLIFNVSMAEIITPNKQSSSFFNTELRSSLDNYSASLGDQVGSGNYNVSLEPPLTGSVTFRLYAYNVPVGATADYIWDQNVTILSGVVAPVPEPSTLALSVMGGLGGLPLFRRRK
jgi:hypothetical protein